MLAQLKAVCAEGIGQNQLRARLDIFAVDGRDRAGIGQVQLIKTLFKTDPAAVQHGAHGAVSQ